MTVHPGDQVADTQLRPADRRSHLTGFRHRARQALDRSFASEAGERVSDAARGARIIG
jgi:hypothetical protein